VKRWYTYTVARIKALEARLPTREQFLMMIEAHPLDQAFFILSETSYGDYMGGTHSFDLDSVLMASLEDVHRLIISAAGDDDDLRRVLRKYDYAVIKYLIRLIGKGGLGDISALPIPDLGTVGAQKIVSYLSGEGRLDGHLEGVSRSAVSRFEEVGDPALVDAMLDELYMEGLEGSGNRFLKRLGALWREVGFTLYPPAGEARMVELLREMGRKSFGIEPIIAFWLWKEIEVRMLKMIFVCKRHGLKIDTQVFKEMKLYV